MGIHFLRCIHGNECIGTHDALHDTFATIAWDVGCHVRQEQLHVLPSITFNFFRWQVDIVSTKDVIRTLADIVIANSMWVDLFSQSCTIQGFVAFDVTQVKENSYCNQHHIDQFLRLTNEVFNCLHNCANAIWSLKKPKGLHLFILVFFFC
jgi:hypothetical protein